MFLDCFQKDSVLMTMSDCLNSDHLRPTLTDLYGSHLRKTIKVKSHSYSHTVGPVAMYFNAK